MASAIREAVLDLVEHLTGSRGVFEDEKFYERCEDGAGDYDHQKRLGILADRLETLTAKPDAEIEVEIRDQAITGTAKVTVLVGEAGAGVEFRNVDGVALGNVWVELYDGRLWARIWNSEDAYSSDPTAAEVIEADPATAYLTRFDGDGKPIPRG